MAATGRGPACCGQAHVRDGVMQTIPRRRPASHGSALAPTRATASGSDAAADLNPAQRLRLLQRRQAVVLLEAARCGRPYCALLDDGQTPAV